MPRLVPILLLAAACGGGTGGAGDDTNLSDAAASSDAPSQHGLLVNIVAMPALPGQLKTDLTVTSAVFHIQRLQVIGDNGQPMTSAPLVLSWQAEGNPPPIDFPSAPSGLYSQVSMEIDDASFNPCYEIFGTTKSMGNMEMFHIVDRNSLDVDITGYTVTLSPGRDAVMGVKLDLKDAIDNVDFGMLPTVQGMRTMDTIDPQMVQFRDKLDEAFKRTP